MSKPMYPIRAHVDGCAKTLSISVDRCSCGGRDFTPEPLAASSSPAWEPKLKALIETWRAVSLQDAHYAHVPKTLRWCANELEALLTLSDPPKAQP